MKPIVVSSIVVISAILFGGTSALAQGWNFNCAKMTSKSSRARCLVQAAARASNVEKVKARRDSRDERKKKFDKNSTKKNN